MFNTPLWNLKSRTNDYRKTPTLSDIISWLPNSAPGASLYFTKEILFPHNVSKPDKFPVQFPCWMANNDNLNIMLQKWQTSLIACGHDFIACNLCSVISNI